MAGEKIYEGKAKILYTTDDPNILLTHFKDDATAFNALKKGTIEHKGAMNCAIASHLFEYLATQNIPTHFIQQTAPDRMQVVAVKILPLEVVVRNIVAGSLCKRTGIAIGTVLKQPLVEFYYKNDDLGDPLFTEDHIALMALASPEQVAQLRQMALTINQHLQDFFLNCQLILVDFKLEFGIDAHGNLLLSDEISPDTCRLWDQTNLDPQARIMDKDRFRQDLGNVAAAYQEVMARIQAVISQKTP
ncbi:phosphoribosylaminoimidazolesuccinocarboxamide synthase [Tumidithrix elongata RA019]|uniref:Phosphoribosylaminoimidazole-succinocarboxamide synthase n=1 Tax=Tumidithrix elongata BACA0141 TaxID=2716417 RepID=A0AAW9Q065_9CYAN|nr:phosphoribosylaminoimidazolesuccinocarboxamide synthase [Tumidithrix elongata RA019]